jgi:hypothetical protein
MIKTNKTTIKAIVHVFSLDGNKLPLWNTHTNTFIDIDKTHHILEITAENKHEVRAKISRMMPTLQHKVQFKKGFETKEGDNATWYIQQIYTK